MKHPAAAKDGSLEVAGAFRRAGQRNIVVVQAFSGLIQGREHLGGVL